MSTIRVNCSCGTVEMELTGDPLIQYYCHCDHCQAVHGDAYACALYPKAAVAVLRGETAEFILVTAPRTKCSRCGTYLFAEVPGRDVRGVNGALFPEGVFTPEFHMQCRFAKNPIPDELPHFKSFPTRFGGTGELMQW